MYSASPKDIFFQNFFKVSGATVKSPSRIIKISLDALSKAKNTASAFPLLGCLKAFISILFLEILFFLITFLISSQVPSLELPSAKMTSILSVNLGSLSIALAILPLSFLQGIITLADFF